MESEPKIDLSELVVEGQDEDDKILTASLRSALDVRDQMYQKKFYRAVSALLLTVVGTLIVCVAMLVYQRVDRVDFDLTDVKSELAEARKDVATSNEKLKSVLEKVDEQDVELNELGKTLAGINTRIIKIEARLQVMSGVKDGK